MRHVDKNLSHAWPQKSKVAKPIPGKLIGECKVLSALDTMAAVAATLKHRVLRAGGWQLARRAIKTIPVAGSLFAVGMAGYAIRKKGLVLGVAHVGLDIIPVVGTAKNVLEIFTGDIIPDKKDRTKPSPKPPVDESLVAD